MGHPGQASQRNHNLNLTEEQREEKRKKNIEYYLKNRTSNKEYRPRKIKYIKKLTEEYNELQKN